MKKYKIFALEITYFEEEDIIRTSVEEPEDSFTDGEDDIFG